MIAAPNWGLLVFIPEMREKAIMEIELPNIDEQYRRVFAEGVEKGCQQLRENLNAPTVVCGIPSPNEAHLKAESEGFEAPPADLVDAWFSHFKETFPEYNTDLKLGRLLGLSGGAADRRIRSFRKGEQVVPYGIWRRFLVITGRVNQEIIPVIAFVR